MRDGLAPIRLVDYTPPAYAAREIDLRFDLDPTDTRVTARTRFERVVAGPAPLKLDGVRLVLEAIAIDGTPLPPEAYTATEDGLTILAPPAAFTLEVVTRLNPAGNTRLEGLYISGGRFCTQCEAEGFRAITYALDRPDSLSRYTVRIEADKAAYPTLLSNGDPIEAGDLTDGRHFAVWRDPHLKPSYLFALVAGAFDSLEDTFLTRSGRRVALGIHVDPGEAHRAAYALDALKRAMRWDEEAFDREYDLDVFNIVAVRDFNFGAMENKGLNIFNSSYVLADAQTATDADFEAIESIVAHEYFHNWTGNRITLRDWFQLCLKEGLTVFRDQEFSADQRSRPVQRIKDVRRLRARQFPEDSGPLAHPVRPASYVKIDNFYTATVYEKGAELVRTLQAIVGPEAFSRGMALYFARHDGRAAVLEDFVSCFADASGEDLSGFLRWYAQPGTPRVIARLQHDPATRTVAVRLRQEHAQRPGRPAPAPVPIPLRIGFISASGADLALRLAGEDAGRLEHRVVLDGETLDLRFEGAPDRPIPAYLRGFSAPVTLDDGLSEADRLAQAAHDPDPFTRWEAGQRLARDSILALAAGGEAGARLDGLRAALARELDRADADPAFAALTLRLPDLADLMQASDAPDPDALFEARRRVRAALADSLADGLAARARVVLEGPFTPDAASAGARALKIAALDLLSASPRHAGLIEGAFETAASMTERMGALEALGQMEGLAFDSALQAFFHDWRDNPLVLDKWFAVQAGAPRADALARVTALRNHPSFELANPNRVRALASPFALRNLTAFHALDGSGYRFLADLAGEADARNPALGARLLTPFEGWARLDPRRQAAARTALQALLAKPGLSENSREILTRTLG